MTKLMRIMTFLTYDQPFLFLFKGYFNTMETY